MKKKLKKSNISKTLKCLVGFDSQGEVFSYGNKIFRGIYKGKGALWRKILKVCKENNLFSHGIVKTRLTSKSLFPELSYDLVLEHEKIPFISYPHEWPTEMLKDAALFHIDLILALNKFGLTLKDFHPFNILFDNSHPMFVDFTSIIFADELINENYLTPKKYKFLFGFLWDVHSKYFYEMYRIMFVPYLFFPLYLMQKGSFKQARLKIINSTLNAQTEPTFKEIDLYRHFSLREKMLYQLTKLIKKILLIEPGNTKKLFLKTLRKEVEAIISALDKSNWSEYYKKKGKDFSFKPSKKWNAKHWTVYQIIKKLKPNTVLDVGCNTGWFSILASKLGCQVVAFDTDEACMNLLYQRVKRESLSILPLVIDFTAPTEDRFANVKDEMADQRQISAESPLILETSKRLKCKMVMALAIIHHFIFLEKMNFQQIVKKLDKLCEKYLLLEFISLQDELIQDPEDYYSIRRNPRKFSWYTRENLILELRKYFKKIEIKDSFPATREVLICTK